MFRVKGQTVCNLDLFVHKWIDENSVRTFARFLGFSQSWFKVGNTGYHMISLKIKSLINVTMTCGPIQYFSSIRKCNRLNYLDISKLKKKLLYLRYLLLDAPFVYVRAIKFLIS